MKLLRNVTLTLTSGARLMKRGSYLHAAADLQQHHGPAPNFTNSQVQARHQLISQTLSHLQGLQPLRILTKGRRPKQGMVGIPS